MPLPSTLLDFYNKIQIKLFFLRVLIYICIDQEKHCTSRYIFSFTHIVNCPICFMLSLSQTHLYDRWLWCWQGWITNFRFSKIPLFHHTKTLQPLSSVRANNTSGGWKEQVCVSETESEHVRVQVCISSSSLILFWINAHYPVNIFAFFSTPNYNPANKIVRVEKRPWKHHLTQPSTNSVERKIWVWEVVSHQTSLWNSQKTRIA